MAFDIGAARRNLQEKSRRRTQVLRKLHYRAQSDTADIVAMLIDRYRPVRIYQWGSVLQPDRFREWSDIDIAVEGLEDPLDGLRAADDASELTSLPVDLVELDRIDPRIADTIRQEGRLMYERPDRR